MVISEREHQGKVAVITGGGRGFGKAFGKALAEHGAHVVLADIDEPAAEAAAKEIIATGGSATGVRCDISDEAQFGAMVADIVARHGGIDILINNAGLHSVQYNQSMAALGIEKIRRLFDVNVIGVIIGSMAVKDAMAGREGAAIVNIGSVGAYECGTAYGASKLAVMGITMTLARELSGDMIRVNAIAPGMLITDTVRADFSQEVIDARVQRQLIKRPGEEQDIVDAMLYLVSSRSKFMTGETLRLSAGSNLSI